MGLALRKLRTAIAINADGELQPRREGRAPSACAIDVVHAARSIVQSRAQRAALDGAQASCGERATANANARGVWPRGTRRFDGADRRKRASARSTIARHGSRRDRSRARRDVRWRTSRA